MSLVAAVLYTEDAVVSASQPMVHFDRGSLKSQTQLHPGTSVFSNLKQTEGETK